MYICIIITFNLIIIYVKILNFYFGHASNMLQVAETEFLKSGLGPTLLF